MDEKLSLLHQEQGKKFEKNWFFVLQQLKMSTTSWSLFVQTEFCVYKILSRHSLHGFHSFLFHSPFLYSFASSQTGLYSSATYGGISNLLAPARSHAKVCKPLILLLIPWCVLCIFYSIQSLRTRTMLTYLCFSSSWLLWHAHHIFLSVLCQLFSLLGRYMNLYCKSNCTIL